MFRALCRIFVECSALRVYNQPQRFIREGTMRTVAGSVMLLLAAIVTAGVLVVADEPPPPWAYGFAGPAPRHPRPRQRRPGGRTGGTPARAGPGRDAEEAARQHAARSPWRRSATASARPTGIRAIIRRCRRSWRTGKRPDVRACSLCHYPNGKGRPENAGVSGLPVSYFLQTMADFKNGARKSADPRKAQHEPHDRDRQGHDRRRDRRPRPSTSAR